MNNQQMNLSKGEDLMFTLLNGALGNRSEYDIICRTDGVQLFFDALFFNHVPDGVLKRISVETMCNKVGRRDTLTIWKRGQRTVLVESNRR